MFQKSLIKFFIHKNKYQTCLKNLKTGEEIYTCEFVLNLTQSSLQQ